MMVHIILELPLPLEVLLSVQVFELVKSVGKFRYQQIHQRYRLINAIDTEVCDTLQTVTIESGATAATMQPYNTDEHIKFLLGFSTTCGPFNQIAICKDSQKLWDSSIYAREQAIIASNSLKDQYTSNFVTVSPLESIAQGIRHCSKFIDIPWSNGFELIEPYHQQLSYIDQILCVIVYITMDVRLPVRFEAYTMIAPEKQDINFLKNRAAAVAYKKYNIRIVNMEGKPNTTTENEAVIVDMIHNQRFINFPTQVLRTQLSNQPASNVGERDGFIQIIMSFAINKSMFITFAMPQYPTWFFPILFKGTDLIIDQRHVIPSAYPALTQDTCEQMFD
ncbi:MAG: hypothetical protein EZS28_014352 [Streblomastix strix]|uniref:Uncharacterized protein n=1 Tax=Streblomastix strix TaxID=222440 RepID=A0A5J4W5S8_9EUKA|nr:MAG: hypothetical protein EZS28_014352 [Streblomastix strix]